MGYRHYLYVAKKRGIKDTFLKILNNNEEYFCICDLKKHGFEEVFELGKYSDEGFNLSTKTIKNIPRSFRKEFLQIKDYFNNDESCFNIVTKDDFEHLIASYHERVKSYYDKLLEEPTLSEKYEENKFTILDKIIHHIHNKRSWLNYAPNLKGNKWTIQTSWLYEYEMFNLAHIYKMLDWNKQIVIIVGY